MNLPTLTEVKPYLEIVTAATALATLTLVLNLAKAFRDAAADRAIVQDERSRVLEERLRAIQEELQRTEKWGEREKAQLTQKNDELKLEWSGNAQLKISCPGCSDVEVYHHTDSWQGIEVDDRSMISAASTNPK